MQFQLSHNVGETGGLPEHEVTIMRYMQSVVLLLKSLQDCRSSCGVDAAVAVADLAVGI